MLSGEVIGQSLGITHHHDIDAFMGKQLPDNVMNLIAINHLAEYIANVESVYNDSEWVKFNTVFKDHLLLSENELDDLQWQIQDWLNTSSLAASDYLNVVRCNAN